MRLLNVTTLTFTDFFSDDIPPYTILSHRWEDSEVTFQDLQNGRGPNMAGWVKIQGCCDQAVRDGFAYTWIDSCCIDKSSSAEISEAINSMFRWYQNAHVCYVYLSDVMPKNERGHSEEDSEFSKSKWFTRGWTLQELIAPDNIIFFDREWTEIGTKLSLRETIEKITGITHLVQPDEACVAQKMSWAARRETTRSEDQAYCLMGLFSVNMPVLYGEGAKSAFYRLQIEILSRSEDESIFAWTDTRYEFGGLLAESVSAFERSGDVTKIDENRWQSRAPVFMTNKGLQIEIEMDPTEWGSNPDFLEFLTPLNCVKGEKKKQLALHLSYEQSWVPPYDRISCNEFKYMDNILLMTDRNTIFVPQRAATLEKPTSETERRRLSLQLDAALKSEFALSILKSDMTWRSFHPDRNFTILRNRRIMPFWLFEDEVGTDMFFLGAHELSGLPLEVSLSESNVADPLNHFQTINIDKFPAGKRSDRAEYVLASGRTVKASVKVSPRTGPRQYVIHLIISDTLELDYIDLSSKL